MAYMTETGLWMPGPAPGGPGSAPERPDEPVAAEPAVNVDPTVQFMQSQDPKGYAWALQHPEAKTVGLRHAGNASGTDYYTAVMTTPDGQFYNEGNPIPPQLAQQYIQQGAANLAQMRASNDAWSQALTGKMAAVGGLMAGGAALNAGLLGAAAPTSSVVEAGSNVPTAVGGWSTGNAASLAPLAEPAMSLAPGMSPLSGALESAVGSAAGQSLIPGSLASGAAAAGAAPGFMSALPGLAAGLGGMTLPSVPPVPPTGPGSPVTPADYAIPPELQNVPNNPLQTGLEPGMLDNLSKTLGIPTSDLIKLGATGIGALAGAVGADSKPAGVTTTTQDIPDWLKPYVVGNLDAAKAYMGTNPQDNSLLAPAIAQQKSTIAGDYLNSNPWLDKTFDVAQRAVTAPIDSRFTAAGRYGSGAHQGVLGTTLDDLATKIYGGNYATERGIQQNAAQNAPAFTTAAGSAPFSAFNQMGNLTKLNVQSTSTPYFTNPVGGALSGALAGYGLSKAFG